MSERKIKVGITLGDVNGIGPETVVKVFSDTQMLDLCTPVIYGSVKVLVHMKRVVENSGPFQFTAVNHPNEIRDGRVNLVNCMSEEFNVEAGVATEDAAKAAVAALREAAKDLKSKAIDVLVTAPINRDNIQVDGFNFRGQTDFLSDQFGEKSLVLMSDSALKVGLATVDLPIAEVSESIKKEELFATIERLNNALISDFAIVAPKIAVLSLNPHSNSRGQLGQEEERAIQPAILDANDKDIYAFGPFSADDFFGLESYKKYDAVLAMYNDQGLAPFRAMAPYGVKYTAGLPIVRTSPDHGVAYDIAGKDVADPTAMREAIYLAIDTYRNRERHQEFVKNPLPFYERERVKHDLSVTELIPEGEEEV